MKSLPPEATVDTIVAISTPPGRGGIGVVRLAGPAALAVAQRLLRLARPLEHARVQRAEVLDSGHPGLESPALRDPDPRDPDPSPPHAACPVVTARVLDQALVSLFQAPHSYTGDTVVEIAAHGSPVVLSALLRGALDAGAALGAAVRLAQPGEFTRRAFLAGKMDLTQAEAVHDLIAAQTLDQARVAAQQMGGAIAHRVTPPKGELLHLIALLEAGMDFASGELDDVETVPPAQIEAGIRSVEGPLQELERSFRRGQLMRDGAAIALIGPPNAGKSSLFNRLLERERAIVTPLPGTTRDTVEESLALGGIPLRLIDTAGVRGGSSVAEAAGVDLAEQHGMLRSRQAMADADLVLLIHDASQEWTEAEREIAAALGARLGAGFDAPPEQSGEGVDAETAEARRAETGMVRPHLVVYNKVDLLAVGALRPAEGIFTSALTGDGIEGLRAAILEQLGAGGGLAESGALNTLRQQEAARAALAALADAKTANASGLPHEVILMDLHRALAALDSLTGATTPDDILERIFAIFCIGK
jgi:tRNA modification GTPase